MKGGTYTKTLAKIQVRGIFGIRDIRRNVLPKLYYRDLYGDAHPQVAQAHYESPEQHYPT